MNSKARSNLFTLRSPQREDVPVLLKLIRSFYAEDGDIIYHPQKVRRAVLELIAHPQYGSIKMIQSGQEPAGYVIVTLGYSLEFHGRDALIDELYLLPEFRGRGWGHKVIDLIEQDLSRQKIYAVHLEVDVGRARLKHYYHRAGYHAHHRHLMTKKLK